MKYVITGAGLIGSAIARRLHEAGHEVETIDVAKVENPPPGRLHTGDIRELETVRELTQGADGIFHTAALHGIHSETHPPSEFMSINVIGTFNVLEAAFLNGVKRVVHSSTVGVVGMGMGRRDGPIPPRVTNDSPLLPLDYYGTSKVMAEELCSFYSRAKGLEVVALRYGGVRQLVQQLLGRIDLRWALTGHLTDLEDVLEANVAAMGMDRLPPRLAYLVLPTTSLNEADFSSGSEYRETLLKRFPFVDPAVLPQDPPRPVSFFDASETERDLGIQVRHGQDEFVSEALSAHVST